MITNYKKKFMITSINMEIIRIGQSLKFESSEVTIAKVLKTTITEEILLTTEKSIIKYIPLHTTYSKEVFQNETTALRILSGSSNIIEIKDFYQKSSFPPAGLIKLDYYERQSLLSLWKTHVFDEQQALQIIKDLLIALSSLEQQEIIHKNISLKNILVSEDFRFVLSGFRNSAFLQDLKRFDFKQVLANIEKTIHPALRPPDFYNEFSIEKFDIWSIGLVLYQLLFRTLPSNFANFNVQDPTLQKILLMCLNPNPLLRPAASSLLFHLQPLPQFVLRNSNEKASFPSSSIATACCFALADSETPPDLYFLQVLTLKSWMFSKKIPKILNLIYESSVNLTLISVKSLLLIHRLIISGPAEMMGSKDFLEKMLKMWTNPQKNKNDYYFSDYFCGLIREFCRVLIQKLNFHSKSNTCGNWKSTIGMNFVDEILSYLVKVVRISEGLTMGVGKTQNLNHFLMTQLLEESQRAMNLVNQVLSSNNANSEVFNSIIQRVGLLNNVAAPQEPDNEGYKSFNQEDKIELPIFAQLEISKKDSYLDERWKIRQEEIKIENLLAGGSSSAVYKGIFKFTPVAIKVIHGTYMGRSLETEFEREVTAMISLRHPNLVLFMGACKVPQMIIVSEFCEGGSLFSLLHEKKNIAISWKQKLKVLKDVARGMLYLHEAPSPILHRDLKSLNLLLVKPVTGPNDDIFIKITDFGIARVMEKNTELTGQMGTCHWMAPEVLSNQPYYLEADVYSYGIVVWEVIAREVPYNGINPMTIPMRVIKGERPNLGQIPSTCPESLKTLVRMCWDPTPAKRPDFNKVLDILEEIEANSFL